MTIPRHLADNPARLYALVQWAKGRAKYLDSPVYLCGSALRDDNADPRDWDIRVHMADERFERRFGGTVEAWAGEGATGEWTALRHGWSQTCVRLAHNAAKIMRLNIDLQINPADWAEQRYPEPKLRLDTLEVERPL